MDFNPEVFSSMIGSIYDAAYERERWEDTLEALRIAFNGSKACLSKLGTEVTAYDSISTNADPHYVHKFLTEHAPYPNILADAVIRVPEGGIYSDHDLVGWDRMRRTRFWNEWMRPQDMFGGLACKLAATKRNFWFFDVQRGHNQPAFDRADVDLMKSIAPHLLRATEISQRFGALNIAASAFDCLPMGVMVLDPDCKVVMLNASAEALVAAPHSGIRLRDGYLRLQSSRLQERFQRAIAGTCHIRDGAPASCEGDILVRQDKDDDEKGQAILLSIGPLLRQDIFADVLGPHAVVLLKASSLDLPPGFAGYLQDIFGLTPKEAAISAALAEGATLKDAADRHGIRFKTARSYLENIFEKTGVRQQSQLVAVLRTVQPIGR